MVCLLASAFLPVIPSCSLPDETAAVVNDHDVPTADLEAAYDEFLSQFGEMTPLDAADARETKRALLEQLIDRKLMGQEVEKRGLRPTEEETVAEMTRIQGGLSDDEFNSVLGEAGADREEWRKSIVWNLSLLKLQEEVVFSRVAVSDGEIEEYIGSHRASYELPEEVRASQILVRTREEAVAASKRIKKGEAFAEVAKEVSLSPDGERGGDLGYFSRGQMPQEFDAVVFPLSKGKLSPVVETTYGHHLFLVTDRRETRRRDEGEVRAEVRRRLETEKREEAFRAWAATLREKARIRYNEDVVSP